MPNRIIKETICTDEQIDGLSESAEILFYRLIVNADDYGLFDARLKLVASKCYPLKSIDIKSIQVDLACLQAVNLVFLYEVDGKPYGKLVTWERHQQVRAKRAKFPLPKTGSEIICNQLLANVPGIQSNPIQSNPAKRDSVQPDGFTEFYQKYPKKVGKPAALKAFKAAKINGHLPDVLSDIDKRMSNGEWSIDKSQFIPNPATYLNQRRWEDEATEVKTSLGVFL